MRRTANVAFILCFCCLLLSSCIGKENVKQLSPEEMIRYVQDRIGEEIELVNVDGEESDDSINYIFRIISRDIKFSVYAHKWADSIDGATFGNYTLKIDIEYIEDIKKHYQVESVKLAEAHSVEYEIGLRGGGSITVKDYSSINNVVDFIIALDQLYAFKYNFAGEPSVGAIVFDRATLSDLHFSQDSSARLEHEALKEQITEKYVTLLKSRHSTDSAIPQEIWDKYNP